MSGKRWDVEVKAGEFEDVGADRVAVESGGVLAFYIVTEVGLPSGGEVTALAVAYAPGAWRTVTEHES